MDNDALRNVFQVSVPVFIGVWRGFIALAKAVSGSAAPETKSTRESASSPHLQINSERRENEEVSREEYEKLCHDFRALQRNFNLLKADQGRMSRDFEDKLEGTTQRFDKLENKLEEMGRDQQKIGNALSEIRGELRSLTGLIRQGWGGLSDRHA